MSNKDASCANDPDFAVISAFLEKFSEQLQVGYPDLKQLQDWITNTDEVPNGLRDLHIKLMRKTRRVVHESAWESALCKFCFTYSSQDGWEIERFGYKKSSLKVKLRILRELLESQFERNKIFRAKLMTMTSDSLRSKPIGRDRLGHSYWMTKDLDCNFRIYQEHLDEEIWQVVATNREEMVKLISRLKDNKVVLPIEIGVLDEDSSSNSCSIVKPPSFEAKVDSQGNNQSTEGRIPNIKIKLGTVNGIVINNEDMSNGSKENVEKYASKENDEEKKVKPLVISHSMMSMEKCYKRPLDELELDEPEELKKQRPSLLDSKREKDLGKYEKAEQDDDDDDDEDDDDEDGEDKEDDEEEEEEEEDEDTADEEEEEQEEDGGEDEEETEENKEAKVEAEDTDGEDMEQKETVDPVVSEAVEAPPVIVNEEGSGNECENSYYDFLSSAELRKDPQFSEVIEELPLFVVGEGTGVECLVGNAKATEAEPFFFGQPGCLKLIPLKNQPKSGDTENCHDKENLDLGKKVSESPLGEYHSGKTTFSAVNAEKPVEKTALNSGIQVEQRSTRRTIISRKRNFNEEKPKKQVRHTTDMISEILQNHNPDVEEEQVIGGKRIRMRFKVVNTENRELVKAEERITSREDKRLDQNIFSKKVEKRIKALFLSPETMSEAAEEDHSTLDSQHQRHKNEKELYTKPSTISSLIITRSSRRSNTPVTVPEFLQPKKTKVKAYAPVKRPEESENKKQVPLKAKTNSKTEVNASHRISQNNPAIRYEVVVDQINGDVKKGDTLDDIKSTNEHPVKEEPELVHSPRPYQKIAQKQPASGQRQHAANTKSLINIESETTPVRHSRRIAQRKKRAEAKLMRISKVKLRKIRAELAKKKREMKKKEQIIKNTPVRRLWWFWNGPEEEEGEERFGDPYCSPFFSYDHEFAPETELEYDSPVVPLKTVRTATQVGGEFGTDAEQPCQKCGKSDEPEWILLCDKCVGRYHCSCLSPVIFYIPEGCWICPPCEQDELIVALESQLEQLDNLLQCKKEEEYKRVRLEMEEMSRERTA